LIPLIHGKSALLEDLGRQFLPRSGIGVCTARQHAVALTDFRICAPERIGKSFYVSSPAFPDAAQVSRSPKARREFSNEENCLISMTQVG